MTRKAVGPIVEVKSIAVAEKCLRHGLRLQEGVILVSGQQANKESAKLENE